MNPMINIGIQAVREASKLLLRSMEHLEAVDLKIENRDHFTAELKRLATEEMSTIIHKAHPSHAITCDNSADLGTRGEACWLINALDGELNFSRNLPHFAISVAIKLQNKITAAVIYDCLRDELFIASQGQGARLNDRRLRVSQTKKLSEALIGCSDNQLNFNKSCRGLRNNGCVSLDLAYVAAARLDAYCSHENSEINTAAALLLVTEAGGLVHQSTSLLAANPKIFNELQENLSIS